MLRVSVPDAADDAQELAGGGGAPAPDVQELRALIDRMRDEMESMRHEIRQQPAAAPPTTTTNVTNNNNITINNFRGVDVSYLAHDLVAQMVKRGDLRKSLQEMVELVHFNPEHPENMNAYLADASHEHGYCFRGGRWQPKARDELAKMVMFNAAQVMNEHNDVPHGKDFTKKQTDRFDRFYDIIGYDRHPLVETIDTMAKNRHVVENAHPAVSALTAAAT